MRHALGATLVSAALNAGAAPWVDMSIGFFNEAHAEFIKEEKSPDADLRALRFGEAVSLLNVQPRTDSNIDRSYAIFGELFAAAPDDDIGWNSRYLQGRIEQQQRSKPDLAKAEAIFTELIRRNPSHSVAQRAQVKLAVIRLYSKTDPAERRRRYDEFTDHVAKFTDTGIKVQMHLLLAEAARRFNFGNETELAHLLAAHEGGVTKRNLRAEALVRIGDLARLTGRVELAREFYTLFLEQFPRNDRLSTIEGYLAVLNAPAR